MIERLYFLSGGGEVTEFSIFSDFHVNVSRDVDGLSDVSNKINTTSTIGQDGESYESSAIEPRDIQITGNLRATDTAAKAQLRRLLNHALSPKQMGYLYYVCGDTRRRIACYAEECPNYTAGTRTKFLIRLQCPSPFWEKEAQETARVMDWEGGMIFDQEDGLTLGETWEVGWRSGDLIVTVENEGDVSCGITILFEAEGTVVNPKLLNATTLEYVRVLTTMVSGDRIEVTTAYGKKSATLIRDGVRTNIFRLTDPSMTFLKLNVGDNLLTCTADAGAGSLNASIQFKTQYLGV